MDAEFLPPDTQAAKVSDILLDSLCLGCRTMTMPSVVVFGDSSVGVLRLMMPELRRSKRRS